MKFLGMSFVLILSLCLPVSAVLITNGDFETVTPSTLGRVNNTQLSDLDGTEWDVYGQIPGWSTVLNFNNGVDCGVSGCTPSGIEVQHNSVVTANSGSRYIELDSHPISTPPVTGGPSVTTYWHNSAMTQQVVALAAGDYLLSFYYMPRTSSQNDNGIQVFWDSAAIGGNSVYTADGPSLGNPNGTWMKQLAMLTVSTPGNYNLTFAAIGAENQLGGFIDDVSLEFKGNPQEVPEPATMGVLGLGLAALAFARRFRS